jgi:hypothetical protein
MLKEAINKVSIATLKAKCRSLYYEMDTIADQYDCGVHLVAEISPRYAKAKEEFKATYARIKELDPTAPELT